MILSKKRAARLVLVLAAAGAFASLLGACESDGPKSCKGTPLSCDSLGWGGYGCTVFGCYIETVCVGTAVPCDERSYSSCYAVDGCILDPPDSCTGTAYPCDSGDDDCFAQLGCSYSHVECTGQPRPCEYYLDADSCEAVPQCSWE